MEHIRSDASDNGSPCCGTGPRASGRDLWVTAQGLAARSVDREVAPACGSEAVSSITAFGWGPLGRLPRTQRHGRAPRTLTSRGPSPFLAVARIGDAGSEERCPRRSSVHSSAGGPRPPGLIAGPGPREFSTDFMHIPVDKNSHERKKRGKNLCNKSGYRKSRFGLAPALRSEYSLGIRIAHRWSRRSGQPGYQVTEVGSESSKGCRFLKAFSEVRGATGDAVVAAELRMAG